MGWGCLLDKFANTNRKHPNFYYYNNYIQHGSGTAGRSAPAVLFYAQFMGSDYVYVLEFCQREGKVKNFTKIWTDQWVKNSMPGGAPAEAAVEAAGAAAGAAGQAAKKKKKK